MPVFHDDTDRKLYLEALFEMARACDVAVHAYVLLDHEVRLLATPRDAGGVGLWMQRVGRRYVAPFNGRHGRRGALWAGRFQASAVDAGEHLMRCIRWIEQAPVRTGIVMQPHDWPWSSAAHHTGGAANPWLREHPERWKTGNTPFEREASHRRELQLPLSDLEEQTLVNSLRGGWPLGGPAFVESLGATAGRRLSRSPRGRPRRVGAPTR